MKGSELRIGNYYMFADYNGIVARKVREIKSNEFGLIGDYDGTNYEICKPIRLTEEWLLKFGFYKNDELFTIEWNEFSFSIFDFDNGKFAINNSFNYVDINYVHQLQNLYFALTGEELIINN